MTRILLVCSVACSFSWCWLLLRMLRPLLPAPWHMVLAAAAAPSAGCSLVLAAAAAAAPSCCLLLGVGFSGCCCPFCCLLLGAMKPGQRFLEPPNLQISKLKAGGYFVEEIVGVEESDDGRRYKVRGQGYNYTQAKTRGTKKSVWLERELQ